MRKMPIFYGAVLLTGVNLLLRLVSTSFQVYLSARIGAEGIGLMQLALSVSMLCMTAATAGIRTTTMYLTAGALGKKKPETLSHILRVCTVYSLVCSTAVASGVYFLAPRIAQSWIGDGRTLDALRLAVCFLPVNCLCGVLTGYFTAAGRIGTLAAVEVAEQLCAMAVTMTALVVWAGNDLGRACFSVVLGSCAGACLTLLCLFFLRKLPKIREKQPVCRDMLGIALPLALADDVKAGISTTENLMVPKRLALFPGTGAPLAAFGTVCGMVFPVLMFPAAILFSLAELLIPEMARCAAAGSQNRIEYLTKRGLRAAMLYGLCCGGLLYLLAEPLCGALYPNSQAAMYLRRFAVLAPMLYCDALTDAMTKGLGQQTYCVRYNILTSAMDVAFLYILLPKYGMAGYFASFLVTHAVNFFLSIRRLLKVTRVRLPFDLPALAVSSALLAVWGADHFSGSLFRAIGFLGLLIPLLSLFSVISREDIRWIASLLRRKK